MALIIIGSIFLVSLLLCVFSFWRSSKYDIGDDAQARKLGMSIAFGAFFGIVSLCTCIWWIGNINSYLECIYKGDKVYPEWGYYSGCVDSSKRNVQAEVSPKETVHEHDCRILIEACKDLNSQQDLCKAAYIFCGKWITR